MVQYTEEWTALDNIAERIRALGHFAPGTYSEYAKLSSIAEPKDVPEALEMVRLLVMGNEAVAKTARAAFQKASKADDQPSADLLTQRLDIHEKMPGCFVAYFNKVSHKLGLYAQPCAPRQTHWYLITAVAHALGFMGRQ